jgi:hypothetical protein
MNVPYVTRQDIFGSIRSTIIRKPKRETVKNISRLKLCASSMKIEINISHTARAIMAICSFLITIPAEETLSLFLDIFYSFQNPNVRD